jgi:hypothetical protein
MLVLMALPVAVAAVLAGLRGGGLRALLRLRLRHRWLILAAAAVQLARLSFPVRGAAPVVLMWSLVVAFVLVNLSPLDRSGRLAALTFAGGLSMNFAAIVTNGGMPFSVPAARTAGFTSAAITADVPAHPHLTTGSRLAALADVLPVPHLHIVASAGDLLIITGIVWLLVSIMVRPGPEARTLSSAVPLAAASLRERQ